MSTLTLDPPRRLADAAEAAHRALVFGLAIQFALLAPSLLALALDDRLLNGIGVWSKPIKFQLSLALLFGTLILLVSLAEPTRGIARACHVITACATFEIGYITLQAARGRASHYNDTTPVETAMYALMGAVVVVLVIAIGWIGFRIWRSPPRPGGEGLRQGAALGLMLGASLTLMTAGVLAQAPGHWVGALAMEAATDAGGLPLFGWSRTGGDLRVPHFFATHIMQALPLAGFAADRLAPGHAVAAVRFGVALALVTVAATFAQAMAGRPFIG